MGAAATHLTLLFLLMTITAAACRGLGAAWHLSHVEVVNHSTGERAAFVADTWLDAKLGPTIITLQPSSGAGACQQVPGADCARCRGASSAHA